MTDNMLLSLKIVWKSVPNNINLNLLKKMANDIAIDFDNKVNITAKKNTVKHVLIQAIALMKDIPVKKDGNEVSIALTAKEKALEEA